MAYNKQARLAEWIDVHLCDDKEPGRDSEREESAGRAEGRRYADDKSPQGQPIAMRVHEIKDKTVVVDLNHPLAGKTLNFDVKVTDIKSAETK